MLLLLFSFAFIIIGLMFYTALKQQKTIRDEETRNVLASAINYMNDALKLIKEYSAADGEKLLKLQNCLMESKKLYNIIIEKMESNKSFIKELQELEAKTIEFVQMIDNLYV